ncbi:hypothetical protein O6H91_06G129400 [Diphasiastrum complanatum]|uniref:Uncharacterized protein n=1 Tax=Diphasiastrum complanatum TaxID=34168 RepID=A0ACC2DJL2_DIPCM|nr:hypothetical protein O6H91_06G129400 [Diphasiastrum complanatum]
MGDTPKRSRYSNSLSPKRGRSRSPSSAYNSHGDDGPKNDANNPGNNLYVTGLSTRVTEQDLEEHLSREGKVVECRLVVDPRTRASRGFGFVEMETVEDADRCIKYLNRSTLEGRIISVEKMLVSTSVIHSLSTPTFDLCSGERILTCQANCCWANQYANHVAEFRFFK